MFYALKYRPVDFATIPKGLEWSYVTAPAIGLRGEGFFLPFESNYPHGVFRTERLLTLDELYNFEVHRVPVEFVADVLKQEVVRRNAPGAELIAKHLIKYAQWERANGGCDA